MPAAPTRIAFDVVTALCALLYFQALHITAQSLLTLHALILPAIIAIAAVLRPRPRAPESPSTRKLAALVLAAIVTAALVATHAELALVTAPLWLFLVATRWMGSEYARNHLPLWAAASVVIPLAPAIALQLDPPIQRATAEVLALLLRILGFDAQPDGALVVGIGTPVIVTAECAGVNVLTGPLVVAVLLGSTLLVDVRTRLRFVAITMVLAAAANMFRMVVVGSAAGLMGPTIATAAHDGVGAVAVLCSYGIAGVLLVRLRRQERAC